MQSVVSFLRCLLADFLVGACLHCARYQLNKLWMRIQTREAFELSITKRHPVIVTKKANKLAICFQDISSVVHICEEQNFPTQRSSNIMFYQDPFLLYQQTSFCHGSSPVRTGSQNRSSFRIDDILVPRQPFLVSKQPGFQESRPPAPNANPLKFGMHSILTQRPREDMPLFQGEEVTLSTFYTAAFCTLKANREFIYLFSIPDF